MKVKNKLLAYNIFIILSVLIAIILAIKTTFFDEKVSIYFLTSILFSLLTIFLYNINEKTKNKFYFPISGELLLVKDNEIIRHADNFLKNELNEGESLYGIIPTKQKIFNFVFRRSLTTNGSEMVDNCEKLNINKYIKEFMVKFKGFSNIGEVIKFIQEKEILMSEIDIEWCDNIPYLDFKRVFSSYYYEKFKKLSVDDFISILTKEISEDFKKYFPNFKVECISNKIKTN